MHCISQLILLSTAAEATDKTFVNQVQDLNTFWGHINKEHLMPLKTCTYTLHSGAIFNMADCDRIRSTCWIHYQPTVKTFILKFVLLIDLIIYRWQTHRVAKACGISVIAQVVHCSTLKTSADPITHHCTNSQHTLNLFILVRRPITCFVCGLYVEKVTLWDVHQLQLLFRDNMESTSSMYRKVPEPAEWENKYQTNSR